MFEIITRKFSSLEFFFFFLQVSMASNSLFSNSSPMLYWGELSPCLCACVCVSHHALEFWDEAGPGHRAVFRTGRSNGASHGTAHNHCKININIINIV